LAVKAAENGSSRRTGQPVVLISVPLASFVHPRSVLATNSRQW
jgi:hypothetical protein